MKDEIGSILFLGTLVCASIYYYHKDTYHFMITDDQIREIASKQIKIEIEAYMELCRPTSNWIPDKNCPVFHEDLEKLNNKINSIELARPIESNKHGICVIKGLGPPTCY